MTWVAVTRSPLSCPLPLWTHLQSRLGDGADTVALRRTCRARKDLVSHRVAAANQLRAHLRNVLPAAVGLFAEIDSPIWHS